MSMLVVAFCGFFVAKADAKLFNESSQVVLVRDGDRTVLTMGSDYQGDPKEFALVVPVPTVVKRDQVSVRELALIDRVDAFTVPRLVEYFDDDPCTEEITITAAAPTIDVTSTSMSTDADDALGVKVEEKYTVDEYDIVILSAKQSGGLQKWLDREGYRVPKAATEVLGSYLKQGMKFFVAKVNLAEHHKRGFQRLRPLQVSYESPKFMLPIRLGMVNATGPQDMFVYAITRKGRVETTNYRTVKLPTDLVVPTFVKSDFGEFYKATFSQQAKKNDDRVVFVEYAWDMSWCDPCASDPLTATEVAALGAFWVDRDSTSVQAFVTRLHLRYDNAHFPEDLVFQVTDDRQNFQGRYILNHPYVGPSSCEKMERYRKELEARRKEETKNLESLTGWSAALIEQKAAAAKRK